MGEFHEFHYCRPWIELSLRQYTKLIDYVAHSRIPYGFPRSDQYRKWQGHQYVTVYSSCNNKMTLFSFAADLRADLNLDDTQLNIILLAFFTPYAYVRVCNRKCHVH